MGKVGGERNFGYGKKMDWAGKNALVDRWVPVSKPAIQALERAGAIQQGSRNLIPPEMSYRQWRDHAYATWRSTAKQYGLSGFHDLRAAYACERYAQLTGIPAPVVTGGRLASKAVDRSARQVLSLELGHGRGGHLRRQPPLMARPANQQTATRAARALLVRRLPGSRRGSVRAHLQRSERIADTVWRRWQVGPHHWQVKHLRWYLTAKAGGFTPGTRYRYWLTVRTLMYALGKNEHWLSQLQGPWVRPNGQAGRLKAGRPAKLCH